MENSELYTELYSKPTSAHQYPHRTTFHHFSLIKSLPKSQFTRIRRICSKLSDYKHQANVFVNYFATRGFNLRKLESMANSVSQMNRDDLLNKPAEKEASQNRISFVLNWHTNFRDFGTIIHRNYRKMLSEYLKIKSVFPAPPLLSFRRNKNLKDILVGSSFTQPSNKPSTALGKPNHRSTLICPAISTSDKVINKKSGSTYFSQKRKLHFVTRSLCC